jgi:hypothetical protein
LVEVFGSGITTKFFVGAIEGRWRSREDVRHVDLLCTRCRRVLFRMLG